MNDPVARRTARSSGVRLGAIPLNEDGGGAEISGFVVSYIGMNLSIYHVEIMRYKAEYEAASAGQSTVGVRVTP